MKPLKWLLPLAAALGTVAAGAATAPLRVCADPNNLPFSNQRLEGFENKIAELVAAELNTPLQYTWMPQRRGFVRRTLNAHECDLVVGVPSGYEPLLSTKPYYRSTYVFTYVKGRDIQLHSFDDPELRRLRIGLQALVDDGYNPPPAYALARRGIVENVVGFMMWDVDSVTDPPGRIIDALAADDIDVAIVWGPLAGYYAKRQKVAMAVIPVAPFIDARGVPFVYDISMGVRREDIALKERLDSSSIAAAPTSSKSSNSTAFRSLPTEPLFPSTTGPTCAGRTPRRTGMHPLLSSPRPLQLLAVLSLVAMAAPRAAEAMSVLAHPGKAHGAINVLRVDNNGDPIKGRRLFLENNCYICHGGRGGGGMCPSLRDSRPDAGDVADAVLNGKPQGMPSFAALLSNLDVNDLAAYIHSLRSQTEPTFNEWWLPQVP